jgi:hypothetical protein
MELPSNAKFWACVLFVVLILVASGITYIIKNEKEPAAPTSDALNKHLQDLEIKSVTKIDKKLGRLISK